MQHAHNTSSRPRAARTHPSRCYTAESSYTPIWMAAASFLLVSCSSASFCVQLSASTRHKRGKRHASGCCAAAPRTPSTCSNHTYMRRL